MGFGSGISVFLRPAYYGGILRTGRPGTREKEIGFDTRVSETSLVWRVRGPKMTFSRPHYYRVSRWNFRVLTVLGTLLVSGFGLEFPCFGGLPSIEESVKDAKQL